MYFSELKDKAVVVTGGGKGIGADIALGFAKLGSRVLITGRDEKVLAACTKTLQQYQRDCSFVPADITSVQQIETLMETARQRLGTIDILINNAGINIVKPATAITEEDWDQVLDTNLKAAFFCCQHAGKSMLDQRKGKIINIASQMAFVGFRNRTAYCSSKGGLVQLTKALAIEWAPFNITVNAVAPTFIVTDLTAGMLTDPDFANDVLGRIPLGRMAEVQDVTGVVLYLASGMANMVTGETIKVDGGWTAI